MFGWWNYSESLNIEFLSEDTGEDVMMNHYQDISQDEAESKLREALSVIIGQ
jgi:hypothetical protein